MYYNYYQFRVAEENPESPDISMVMEAGTLTLLCQMHFDSDVVSETYNHWIVTLDVVSDEMSYPERSFVLHPSTLHFEGDDLFILGVASELEYVGKDDLTKVYFNIGVPVYE